MKLHEIDLTGGKSKGEQVLAYIDCLDNASLLPEIRDAFEKLGAKLFSRNFQFISGSQRFFKPDPEDNGAWVVLLAGKLRYSIWAKNVELVYYDKARTSEYSQTMDIDRFVQNTDEFLDKARSSTLDPF